MVTEQGSFDYVIVGAGSAGCILAERLTRCGRHRVLLVEAGPRDSSPFIRMPRGFGRTLANPALTWYYLTEAEPEHAELGSQMWLRGRTLGGSSAVNGMIYVRGQPEDFDGWAVAGASGWNAAAMSAAYEELEQELDTSIQSCDSILSRAIIDAARSIGIPERHDARGVDGEGIGGTPCTIHCGRRVSAAHAFLRKAQARPNLRVETDVLVDRLLFKDDRVVGIQAGERCWSAGEVILATGAIESPALLQRSGIGPAKTLAAAGVDLVRDLPGVGSNLREHKLLSMQFRLNNWMSDNREFSGWRLIRNALRYGLTRGGPLARTYDLNAFVKSNPDAVRADAQITLSAFSLDFAAGGMKFEPFPGMQLFAYPLRPTSQGRIDIISPDPQVAPRIRPNYLATAYDRQVTVDLVHLLRRLAAAVPLAALIHSETRPGMTMADDDASILEAVRRDQSCAHAVGTCRMGAADDPDAVVDPRLRVRGIGGLRVMDCSVMPTQVSGNTNAPVMAMAIRAAQIIAEDANG